MEEGKEADFFEKYGLAPKESDKEHDDLRKEIERKVELHKHFEQLSKGNHILMMEKRDIYQITREFKQHLFELNSSFLEVAFQDICIRTGYSEEIVSDIIKYLGSDIIAKEKDGVTYFSLRENR
jgi:hypothetical protein